MEILRHLSKRGSTWPEASSAAIRDLQARMTDHPIQNASRDTLSGEIGNNALIESSHTGFLPSSARHDPLYSDEAPLGTMNESTTATNSNQELNQAHTEKGSDLGFDSSYWEACVAPEHKRLEMPHPL